MAGPFCGMSKNSPEDFFASLVGLARDILILCMDRAYFFAGDFILSDIF